MKIPLYLPKCKKCGINSYTWINLHDSYLKHNCECGNDLSGAIDPSVTVGFRGLYRSEYELNKSDDHILSIVLSAIAFEWEIAHLHNKWIHIDALDQGEFLTSEMLKISLKKYRTIFDKIRATGNLLHPEGFEKFAQHDHELYETINKSFPSLSFNSLIKDFEKKLFWPRNMILHNGDTNYNREDAIKSYNISYLGMVILKNMDNYRRNV